jgi:hypothetical protein
MIDKETRQKIIQLHRENYTKTEIKKTMGVSLPTIRKIIGEYEEQLKQSTDGLEEIHLFYIKTTQHFPMTGAPLFQALEKGTAFRFIEANLTQMFDHDVAAKISYEIEKHGKRGEYKVSLRKKAKLVTVQVTPLLPNSLFQF